jgi:hypothetical protein
MVFVFPRLRGLSVNQQILLSTVWYSPVCGGYRSSSRNSDRQCRYSPRVRGLSVNVLLIYECGDVFPPTGGYRSKSKIRLFEKWYSPAYGGYRHEPAHSDAHLLYSPHAGVIGRPGAQENWLNSIPPAYGGYRFPALRRWWSPRTPPHAGVIGRFGFCETGAGRIPPACGGYRGMSENHCESVVYSLSMGVST